MYYKEIAGIKVSALGMGNMRLLFLKHKNDAEKRFVFSAMAL